jgi:hypothetical protein
VLVSLAQALEIPLAELVSFAGPAPRPVGE